MTKKATTKKKAAIKKTPLTRQQIRDQLLGDAHKPKRELLTIFGIEIELQQPTLRGILDVQEITDTKERSAGMIIDYAYVPGSNERIFEPADREIILGWPFNDEIVKLQLAIAKLTGVDIEEAEAILKGAPLDEQS